MQKSNRLRNLFILLAAVVLGSLIGFTVFSYADKANDDNEDKVQSESTEEFQDADLEVVYPDGSVKQYELNFAEGETAFEAIQRLKNQNSEFTFEYGTFEGLGAYITSINGISADPASEFISFQVNGQDSMEGISSYVVKKDDKLSFKVVKFN